MTPEAWTAIAIVAVPAFLAASGAVLLGLINRSKLDGLHVIINSRLSELVAANSRAEHAEGMAAGGASAADIERMIDAAIARAATIPPSISPELLAAAISDRAAVVAVQLTSTAADVAANLKERSPP